MNFGLSLDEIERHFRAAWKQTQHKTVQVPAYGLAWQEAKQAINSLIKELVVDAKPDYCDGSEKCSCSTEMEKYTNSGKETAIIQFEQNLLKELEEE